MTDEATCAKRNMLVLSLRARFFFCFFRPSVLY